MSTFTNLSKSSTTFTSVSMALLNLIWDEAFDTWDDSELSTWYAQRNSFTTITKSSTTFTGLSPS